ncbi:MFS general substrate transporter [Ceraceosorus guamensis]|uniref:MFS general substrate transporter n=1 Tax=Ceraceosorus guamensis TaxID=1522189 RepID=A0A316W0M2_9BASI|nr:MFS general substrate transporter [Ceraceosorus guamensis]PWN43084.1 MFS general substrate transporter [Ceraceosorus guamensis]
MKDITSGLFKLPTREERVANRAGAPLNPFKLMAMLTPMQGAMFFSGWLAWTMDAIDFFSVSLSVNRLVEFFERDAHTITTSITLTLLFRSLGAVVAGLISDRYGRKWPLVVNLLLIGVLSLGTGFTQTFPQFLAVRCLFGIAMGGIWGMATATALENMPVAPRGLFSGILQQGYAVGYLLAASVNLTWVHRTDNWRILFWLGAGLSAFAAIVRALLPESELFERQKAERKANPNTTTGESPAKIFWRETGQMLKTHWPRVVYGILLMTGFNFLSHSSQDLYPTIIQTTKLARLPTPEASALASKATIIGNCGAVAGGLVAGYISQFLGRRLTIIGFVLMTGALIPAWILPTSFSGLAAGAFWIQFGVQGAWGVVPIFLSEISPPAFRATFAGTAYQIGNMVSSASAQIEATGGEHNQIANPRYNPALPVSSKNELTIPDYAKVSAILLGVVCAYLVAVVVLGLPEQHGAHFEEAPVATVAHAGEVKPDDLEKGDRIDQHSSTEHVGDRAIDSNDNSEKGSQKGH